MAGKNQGRRYKQRKIMPILRSSQRLAYLALGTLLVAVIGLALWWQWGIQGRINSPTSLVNGPRLAVDKEEIDFGRVRVGRVVKVAFRLSNVGDQPLHILGKPLVEVAKGCCPPEAVVGATTLRPGQETTLSMQFTMHLGMEGPHEFLVRLKTNDPLVWEKVLVVKSDWVR